MACSRHSQATAANAHRQRARWSAGPGRVQAGPCAATSDDAACSTRNASRSRELTPAGSVLVGARTSAAKSVHRGQHSVPRAAQHKTTTRTPRARWRRALVATGRAATCNPGRCGGRFDRSAISSMHAHAHTHSLTSTHTHAPHAHANTHTRTLMCAHRHTDTQKQIHTHTRAAPALAQLRAAMSRNPRRSCGQG